ncbi:MAG: hypothetical protein J07HQW2_00584 [Haloquadratum walsbyi J07HQW2]|uniref:Uncharacterized protein n=1 Tax=Haloquadratum walsbyi J07HQW2 TaxID=1238425 RepID=U1NB91_9EURY|nr:MAG: hypothetical protein J07HQW2_00584 [Haloquadratum walsbyi J07HQW2]
MLPLRERECREDDAADVPCNRCVVVKDLGPIRPLRHREMGDVGRGPAEQ